MKKCDLCYQGCVASDGMELKNELKGFKAW